jgi:hypothetical protein
MAREWDDALSVGLARARDQAAAKYAETSAIDTNPGPMRWQVLYSDGSGRWRVGDVGFEVENSYPEKYDRMLLLPQGEFYFHAHEIERVTAVNVTTDALEPPCGHLVEVVWPEDWVDGLVTCACNQWYAARDGDVVDYSDAAEIERDVAQTILMGRLNPLSVPEATRLFTKIRDRLLASPAVQADPEAYARLSAPGWVESLVAGRDRPAG